MGTKIKVLTLNCWGVFIPVACQLRRERIEAIGKELSKGEYDIILLQEIWTQSDYDSICAKVLTVTAYAHYFHSGMFGSGTCILSKFPILETLGHQFSLNGYPHKVTHGDWFGGKMVGMARVLVNDIRINVYVTHTHAQYNEARDEYCAHRAVQGFEMSQFIKHTSETCDAVIVGGDFNFQPSELGYKLIRYNGNVQDAWLSQKSKPLPGSNEHTCDRPDNPFTRASALDRHPDGIRLDYVMFRSNAGYSMECDKCFVTMQQVPDAPYNFSDHEGVAAVFTIKKNVTALPPPRESGEIEKHLTNAIPVLDDGIKKVKSDQVYYAVAMVLCFIAIMFTSGLTLPFGMTFFITLLRGVLVIGMAFCFWTAIVLANKEMNGIIAARKDINNALKSNPVM